MRDEDVTERYTMYIQPHPDACLTLAYRGGGRPRGVWPDCADVECYSGDACTRWVKRPKLLPASRDGAVARPPTRVNALVSKWVENIRVNAGGRFLTRPNAIATETFLGGVTSMIEIRGAGPMSESIQPVQGFSVGNDVKELLALEVKAFEDASGWNAVSRGQVTGESGRAIIASREQLERIFAPGIQAQAMGFTEWAKIAMAGMKWGYDVPRQLGAVGKNRPDLAPCHYDHRL
jgi:hypothetical protein